MAADVTATIEAVLDSKKYEAGAAKIGEASKKAEKDSKGLFEALTNPANLAKGLLGAAAAEAIFKVGEAILDVTKEAAEFLKLNEKFEAVFKGTGDAGDKMREELVAGYQISTADATKFLAAIQDTQEGLGVGAKEAAKFSGESVKLARQLEEFGKGNIQGNLDAIQASFLGNYRGLRQLNVSLDDSKVALLAQAQGFEVVNGKVSQNVREQIILEQITKANKNAIDQWNKGGLSASQTIDLMKARFSDLKLAFGLSFQNELKKSSGGFGEFIQKFGTLQNFSVIATKSIQLFKYALDVSLIPIKVLIALGETLFTPFIKGAKLVYTAVTEGPKKAFDEVVTSAKDFAKNVQAAFGETLKVAESGGKALGNFLTGHWKEGKANLEDFKKSSASLGDALVKIAPPGLVNGIKAFTDVAKDGVAVLSNWKTTAEKAKEKEQELAAAIEEDTQRAFEARQQKLKEDEKYQKYIGNNLKAELDAAEAAYNQEIKDAKGNAEKKKAIDEAYAKEKIKINLKAAKEVVDNLAEVASKGAKVVENISALSNRRVEKEYQDLKDKLSDLDDAYSETKKQRANEDYGDQAAQLQQEVADAQAAGDQKTAADKQRQLARLQQDKQYQDKKDVLEAEAKAKESKIKEEEFNRKKAADIIGAIIDTARSIVAALTIPPPAGEILAGINAAAGATAIALIASQPTPKFARGGTSSGGQALVGEEGPELVNLPAGAEVIPAGRTRNMLQGISVGGSRTSNSYSKSSSQVNDNRQFSLTANGISDPLKLINMAKKQLGDDVFESSKSRARI